MQHCGYDRQALFDDRNADGLPIGTTIVTAIVNRRLTIANYARQCWFDNRYTIGTLAALS